MKKKVLALVLSLVMLVGIIPAAVYAAEGDPKVVLTITPDKTTAVAGDEVTFTVSLESEYALASMAFRTVFPEGLEYVDNSGAIDANATAALSFDKIDWTEWSKRGDVKGDNYINGYGTPAAAAEGAVVICTFKATFAEGAKLGEYAMGLTGLDEYCDTEWNIFAEDEISVVSTPVELVDHVCSADKLTFVEAVEADCENDGNVAYYECECGTKYADEAMSEILQDVIVPALGHTEGEAVKENEVAADCENDGSYDTVVYCTVCGEELSRETTTTAALGHTEAEAVEENRVEADCENDGSYDMVVYCSVCGEELSRESFVIDALGHDYESVVTAPTCTEAGYTTYTCSACGDSYVADEVAAIGHDFPAKEEWVESTTEKGWFYGYCKNGCGEAQKELRTIYVDGIDLIQDKLPLHYVRKDVAVTLKADISPVDASEDYKVTWTSSNEKVVTVDEDGNVTTHKHGEAVITVTVEKEDGTTYSDTCNVKVTYTWWQWLIWFFLLGCCWYFV